jgi:tetratricopeptide (TPR) repeat protein
MQKNYGHMRLTFILFFFTLGLCGVSAQDNAIENLKIAIDLNAKKEYERSIVFCNLALDAYPEMSDAWFLRGFNNYQLSNLADAKVDFSVAINFAPAYAEAYYYRGKVKQAEGNWMGALKDMNQARKLDSSKSSFLLVRSLFSSIFASD